jgi:hypothetical protein
VFKSLSVVLNRRDRDAFRPEPHALFEHPIPCPPRQSIVALPNDVANRP